MPYSFYSHFLLFLATVTSELILGIKRVAREVCEARHLPEDVILSADLAGRTQLKTSRGLDAGKVVVLAFEFESAGLASRGAFVVFWEDSQVFFGVRDAGEARGR